MKVAKFGGTSLATAEQIRKICDIVAADADRRIVVVSAPGKRFPDDIKVTDLLIQCAKEALLKFETRRAFDAVIQRFRDIQAELGLSGEIVEEIAKDLQGRLDGDGSHEARFVDTVKAAGEDYAARITAATLTARGHEAHYICPKDAGLLLSDEFGNAQVLPESYENLKHLREAPGISVFPGFFGYTRSGAVATFPRGGSDITGAILAAAVGADLYENFTDVDSVFSADPRVIPNARPIGEISYREMRELSYSGFAVFHAEAIQPAIHAGISICIKNTNCPQAPGTRVVPRRDYVPGEALGIAASGGFCSVFIEKYLMNRMVGFGRRVLTILEDEGLPYQHTPSGIDNMSVILREEKFDEEAERRVLARIREELEPDVLSVERDLTLIMLVGEGMRHAIGVAAQATGALARAKVNIEMINQGSSEISMMFGVKSADKSRAVQALYESFFGGKEPIHV